MDSFSTQTPNNPVINIDSSPANTPNNRDIHIYYSPTPPPNTPHIINIDSSPSTPVTPSTPTDIEARFYTSPSTTTNRTSKPPTNKNRLSNIFLPTFQPKTSPPSPHLSAQEIPPYDPTTKYIFPPSSSLALEHRHHPLLATSSDIPEPDPQIDYYALQTLLGCLGNLLNKRDHKRYDYLIDARKGYYKAASGLLQVHNVLLDAKMWGDSLHRDIEAIKNEMVSLGGGKGWKINGKGEEKRLAILRKEWRENIRWLRKNELEVRELVMKMENSYRVNGAATQMFSATKEDYIKTDLQPMLAYWRQAFGHKFGEGGRKVGEVGSGAGKLFFCWLVSCESGFTDNGRCDVGVSMVRCGNDESMGSTSHASSTEDPCPGCVAAEARETVMDTSA
ncbi:MAG: hypothetical protein M1812_004951 [Candelaria pacifica]|nr:MAG: hypothetical protein M1812_004951 [Candelaria pacifica]